MAVQERLSDQQRIDDRRGLRVINQNQHLTVFLEGEKDSLKGFKISPFLIKEVIERNPHIANRVAILDEHSEHLFRSRKKSNSVNTEFWKTQIKNDGEFLREQLENVEFPSTMETEISDAYDKLCKDKGREDVLVAVTSSDDGVIEQRVAFLGQRGKADIMKSIRKWLVLEFTDEEISRRNKSRLKEIDRILESGLGNFSKAMRESRRYSHSETGPTIVVKEMANLSRDK